MKRLYLSLFLMVGGAMAWADDAAFKMALDEANRGDKDKAIIDLQRLEKQNPSDSRIPLSLGLVYQSTDQHDLAIPELERAHSIEPTLQGTYALGLLYESKWVKTDQEDWKRKAMGAWEEYLKLAPLDDGHRSRVEHHLKKLRNNE